MAGISTSEIAKLRDGNQLPPITEDVKVTVGPKELTLAGIRESKPGGENKNGSFPLETYRGNVKLKQERRGWLSYLGILYAISSSLMFTLGILIVKSIPQYHPYTKTFWRFQGVLFPAILMMLYSRVMKKEMIFNQIFPITAPGHSKTLFLLLIRVICGTSASIFQFYSLRYISMADCSVIGVSTPVFVSIASHFLLGERSGFVPIICGVVTLGGVAIIARPPILTGEGSFDTQTLIGTGLASAGMLCVGTVFLLLRYLRQIHLSVITAWFGFWGVAQSLALCATISTFQLPEGLPHWGLAVALAVCAFLEKTFITLALKYERAETISLCRTCDILFADLWQFLFLGQVPDLFSFIGGGVVIFGVLVAALRKHLSELPEDSPTRKRFWILLK